MTDIHHPSSETGLPACFADYEIHGVREFRRGDGRSYCEQVPGEEAQFWCLYGHIPGEGLDCIGDFTTRGDAERAYARITGQPYGAPPGLTHYSVLLLYPDYASDSHGTETYYTFVLARDPIGAVAVAQREAAAAQEDTDIDPEDFAPLLVTRGHHPSEPLFNR